MNQSVADLKTEQISISSQLENLYFFSDEFPMEFPMENPIHCVAERFDSGGEIHIWSHLADQLHPIYPKVLVVELAAALDGHLCVTWRRKIAMAVMVYGCLWDI